MAVSTADFTLVVNSAIYSTLRVPTFWKISEYQENFFDWNIQKFCTLSGIFSVRCHLHSCLLTHTHTFNGLLSRTTWVSRHQKGKPFWILLKHEMGLQWPQLDHKQIICTTLQTDNHASSPSLNFYRPDALLDAQPTVSKH